MMWQYAACVGISYIYVVCTQDVQSTKGYRSFWVSPRQLAQQALARLRGRRLQAFLQELGAVARGEHTVDMLQTYAE